MAAALRYTTHTARFEKRSNTRLESTYAAEYAFEQAYQQLSGLVGQDSTALPSISQLTAVTNLTTAPATSFPSGQGYTWKAFLTVPIDATGTIVSAHANFNSSQGRYKFMSIVEFSRSVAGHPATDLHFQREWAFVLTPLFQYAIFYNRDMELFPGATFVVNGRVHTNGKLYTGTSASINYNDYVSTVGGVSNNYHPQDPRGPGSPGTNITYAKGPPIVTTPEEPPGSLNQDLSDTSSNNDGPRELIEIADVMYTDPNSAERLYNKAGLKILVNTTTSPAASPNSITVPANTRVFLTRDGTPIPATDPLAALLGTIVATGSMKDYRENATLTTTDVNVSTLNSTYNAGGLPQTIPASANWPNNASVPTSLRGKPIPTELQGKSLWNGVLYVADITNSLSHRAGVRLLNGASLPDGANSGSPTAGLTLATPNAAYIVGDYNTGGSPPVNSGSSLTASNKVSGYTVQAASIVADAVTVVSSNWISGNYNTVSSLSSRTPVNTTINAAVVAGSIDSNGSAYSGGVENFFRLLENWSGRRLTYYGSIINLYQSKESTAVWKTTGVYYNAPTRNWYFDVNFLDPSKLPPGTPVVRSLKRGQWAQIR